MAVPETVQQLWEEKVLPDIQVALKYPFQSSEPPLSLVTHFTNQGLSLTIAVVTTIRAEAIALEAICRQAVPLFPKNLIGRMFSYAPRYVDLAERMIGGTSTDEIMEEQIRNAAAAGETWNEANIQAFRGVLIRLVPVQTGDRSGFRLIDTFTSPASLTVFRNFRNDPYPEITGELIFLGGQRYKTIYRASDELGLA